jgi:internalin A
MSELALQLIAKEKKERTGKLDLGNCGLTDFPEELFELEWLEELNFCDEYSDNENHYWIVSSNIGKGNRIEQSTLPEKFARFQQLKTLRIGGDYIDKCKINDCTILGKLQSLTNLFLTHNEISDLRFLENLTGLTRLVLYGNQISDISILENLKDLTSLDLRSNQISDFSILEKLMGLTRLYLGGNLIRDIAVLEKLTGLTHLDLRFNKISDISILGKLTGLTRLDLGNNEISNISILEKLTNLGSLDLRENQISDFSILGKLTGLTHLDLGNNEISDFSFFEKLTSLNSLYLRSNKISDIPILEKLTGLTTLDLNGNQISDISILGKLTGLTTLDLSGNQISDISILGKLTGITSLDLSYNEISDISILEKLTGLTRLNLSKNKISNIYFLKNLMLLTDLDLRGNRISDYSFLESLTCLTSLDLGSNQIIDISFLKYLTGLKSLSLGGNQINNIRFLEGLTGLSSLNLFDNQINEIHFLENMTGLTSLFLGKNRISDICFLEKLTGLTSLDLSYNQISDISILDNLTGLTSLDLSNNQINNIQALIPLMQKGLPVNLKEFRREGISLYNNPIVNPPFDIIKQGNRAILDWFEATKVKLNEIKIILLGDPKAGKTSLLKRLKYDTFNKDEVQTDGVNIEDIEFGKCETFLEQSKLHSITGHFWDFGGQEIMNATHQFFLTKRAVYVLVLDARKDANNSSHVRQWVKRIRATGDNSPIIVLANQIDVNPGFGFENERELQNEFPQIKCFLKVSCYTDENIYVLRNKLEEIIPTAELFNSEIDERWIIIKNVLEKRTNAKYFLDEKRFVNICNRAGLKERHKQNSAITFLHDLGVVLHFDDLNLAEYYVLDPYWITYGVYQILTSNYASNKKGQVRMDELEHIVNEEEDKKETYKPANYKKIEYSTNDRRFLIEILNQFKLCFCTADQSEFIIPDLLDTAEPTEVADSIRTSSEHIQFVYEYEYLPKFVMPNIMVEMHKYIKIIYKWRTGCVLQKDGYQALITNYQNRITIVVTGEHKKKREFMSVIRFVINSINEKLSDKPVALIPLPGINAFADYERLLQREKKGKKYYIHDEDLPTEKSFLISELLEGIPGEEEVRSTGAEILAIVKDIQCDIKDIADKINSHYEYLINLPDNNTIRDGIYEMMQELNAQQTAEITGEIMDWVTTAFVEFDGEMDKKLQDIYNDLKKTDDIQAKLKLSIPFINMLGINFETEFDVKSWAKKMYKKYELKLFSLMSS